MNIEIKSWLDSNRDYEPGVQLYGRFGQSQNLKRILERSESCQEHLDTLTYELGQLLDAPVEEKRRSTHVSMPRNSAIEVQPVIEIGRFDKEDAALFETIKEKLKLRDHLHATLEFVSPEQRKNNALMILDISDQISEDYQRHEHFKKHGVLPSGKTVDVKSYEKPVSALSEAELEKRKINIRTQISYFKKKIKDSDNASKKKHNEQMLRAWQQKLDEIMKLIK